MDSENMVCGEISRRLAWAPIRVLAIISGLFLLRGLGALFLRYCLAFRRKASVSFEQNTLILREEWVLWGKPIRSAVVQSPVSDITAVRMERRQRYLYLLLGFGSLSVGTLVGIQWFVDGLRAGYPHLALIGAGVVLAGVMIDIVLYLFVPTGWGQRVLILSMGPWAVRLSGVEPEAASLFQESIRNRWHQAMVRET